MKDKKDKKNISTKSDIDGTAEQINICSSFQKESTIHMMLQLNCNLMKYNTGKREF